MKKHVPNALTSFNLLFGCLSIIASLVNNDLELAAYFIGAAAILDFFDGFVARALNVGSEMGKQLDSLADCVSFGVAPGFIFYKITNIPIDFSQFNFMAYIPFLIPVFSAIRLAKFNIDTRQTDSFIGVPTPANSLFIAALPFVISANSFGLGNIFQNQWFLIIFPFVSAYLLVAELPLFALKFKSFAWQANQLRYIFLLCCLISLFAFGYLGINISIILYILFSIYNEKMAKTKHH
jgi:CDP-diacylglycerol--serine O-phosphatidyltransferase